MKKYIISIFLIVLIVPSIAFASWWNPFSWFNNWNIFHRVDTKTQVLENRIRELENKIDVATTTNSTTTEKKAVKTEGEDKVITDKEKFDKVCKSVSGVNSVWNGVETNSLAPRMLCNCKTGYKWSSEGATCITTSISPALDYSKYTNPITGQIYTPKEYADIVVPHGINPVTGDYYTLKEILVEKTDAQKCTEKYGSYTLPERNGEGVLFCGCKNGYDWNSTRTFCQALQQNNSNYDIYNVSINSGIDYTADELNQIDCAYYHINCPTIDVRILKY